MTGYYVAVGVLALLSLASIVFSLLVAVRLHRLERRLQGEGAPADLATDPPPVAAAPLPPPPATSESADRFTSALLAGEMSLRLSQETREPPEKYRYVTGLADQGMSAAEIARVLHLAPGEVEQLLTLARLGRGGDE